MAYGSWLIGFLHLVASLAISTFGSSSDCCAQAPNWFVGDWSGTIHQPNISATYVGYISISARTANTDVGSSFYPHFNCGGTLRLVAASATQATVRETITFGPCITGNLVLDRVSPTQLRYSFFTLGGTQLIFSELFTRSQPPICDNPELLDTFSANHPEYHFYQLPSLVCTPAEGSDRCPCSASRVFQLMLSALKFDAPAIPAEANKPIVNCASYNLLGVTSSNPITTVVDNAAMTVTNLTMPGHIFHPGRIVRRVVQVNGDIYVLTTGEGIGPNRSLNLYAGPIIFGQIDQQLRLAFLLAQF